MADLRGSRSGAADLDAVIHSMPDAVYVGDERGVSACNDAALLMLGCEDLSELEGPPLFSSRGYNTATRRPGSEFPRTRNRSSAPLRVRPSSRRSSRGTARPGRT